LPEDVLLSTEEESKIEIDYLNTTRAETKTKLMVR